MKKAIVLLSGGIDSATTLFWAKNKGFRCYCLIFDYGQRHRKEINYAKKIAKAANCEYGLMKIRLPWKDSALLDRRASVTNTKTFSAAGKIPSTYVPARNTIFLSIALSCAESIKADIILIGANAVDFSGYPDCRTGYYNVFKKLARIGTKCGMEGRAVNILPPLMHLNKVQIIKLAMKLKVPINLTWSCYKGGKSPCGKCESCIIRNKGMKGAGLLK